MHSKSDRSLPNHAVAKAWTFDLSLHRPCITIPPCSCCCCRRPQGVSSKVAVCRTCGLKLADCAGHFGYLRLELPVFHVGYFRNTVQLLQCICKTCSRVLLPEEERRRWIK